MISSSWRETLLFSDFRILSYASLVHSFGNGMEHVVLGWLVFELTDSPFMVGLASALRMAPLFVLGIFSGLVADSNDRRSYMKVSTFAGGVTMIVLGILLITGVANVWVVIGLITVCGVTFAFLLTLRQAYTYDIVGPENALTGLSILQISTLIGGVFGALISGVLIAEFGAGLQFVVIGLFYFGSVAFLLYVKDPGKSAPIAVSSDYNFSRNIRRYLDLLRAYPVLFALMVLASLTEIFGFSHMSLIPVFTKDVLGLGAMGLGVITAIRQLGGVSGLMFLAAFGRINYKGYLMFGIMIFFGLSQVTMFSATNIYFAALVIFIINACAMSVDVLFKTLMQLNVPNEYRGVAMGSWVFSIGTGPIGHVGIGAIAGQFGSARAFLFNGVILSSLGLITMVANPLLRKLK
ncbi:MAG: MFS transporter [Dehalococcoidia bacterium]